MADTEFLTTPAPTGPNPYRKDEPLNRPGRFLVWETESAYCRKDVEIDNSTSTASILPGTVIDDEGEFVGILYGDPVPAGAVEIRTVVYRGPAIVAAYQLIFRTVTNAPDGADTGSDNTAENAAATVALEASLRAAMAAAGIDIQ